MAGDQGARREALIATLLPVSAGSRRPRRVLRRAAEVDALQVAMAVDGCAPRPLDLLALYLPGLDIAQHALLGSGAAASPSALAARLEGVRSYYVYLDGLLQRRAGRRRQTSWCSARAARAARDDRPWH